MYRQIVFVAVCLIFPLHKISATVIDDRPSISSIGGDLIFGVASGNSIQFKLNKGSKFYLGDVDLSPFANDINTSFNSLQQCTVDSKNALEKISKYEGYLEGPNGLITRLGSLERFANSTNLLVFAIARPLRRRVNNLHKRLSTLIQSLSANECGSNPCQNGGTCQDLFNSYNCLCPANWEGGNCERDVNECNKFSNTELGCQNGATCNNKPGSYECTCAEGWFGIHCTQRTQDCTNTVEVCGHGICVPQGNSYKCICDQGWKTDGVKPACTVDVNECDSYHPPCSSNPPVKCINLPGTFYCGHCPAGFTGNGFYCSDINECEILNGGCSMYPMVQCVNVPGTRICGRCPPGYAGNGVSCTFQGVCAVSNGGCHPIAQCRENPRISETYVECICPPSYSGDGYGPKGCVKGPQDACSSNPCLSGTCTPSATGYTCNCTAKYTGRNCDIRKDPCDSNPCLNGGTCISLVQFSFACTCPSGYSGPYCKTFNQCGQLMGSVGKFEYPPVDLLITRDSQLNCAWRIVTASNKVLNVTFHGLYIPVCTHNFLQIHDGWDSASTLLGRFCENKLKNGTSIASTTDSLFLWFKGDGQAPKPYMNISWATVDPVCGSSLDIHESGTFKSPGSPQNYPPKRDCYWKLKVPLKKRIKFTFYHLEIGNNTDCNKDFLSFNEGLEPSEAFFFKKCTSENVEPIFSPSNEVTAHLHTVGSYSGFLIHYSIIDGIEGCGGIYTHKSGTISSPKILSSNTNEGPIECQYSINLPYPARIAIHFNKFTGTAKSVNCIGDTYLAIYQGNSINSPLIGRYCGDHKPPDLTLSQSQALFVYKYYRYNDNNPEFQLEYKIVCGGTYTEESSTIKTPNYPFPIPIVEPAECIYVIMRPPGSKIKFQITDFNMSVSSNNWNCNQGYLEFFDGHEENSTDHRRLCASFPNEPFYSHNNVVTIKYNAKSGTVIGFSLNYESIANDDCGGVLTAKFGSVETPKNLDSYDKGLNCSWVISAPPGYLIEINWLQFNLEDSYLCTYDYVKIFDNATNPGATIGTYCGNRLPPIITTTANLATVLFNVDSLNNYDGFYFTYRFINVTNVCGGHYFSPSGIIKSPLYPANYANNRNCIWIITVPPGEQIMLNVTHFDVEVSNACRYDSLHILNGGTIMSPEIGKFCGNTIPKTIYSHTNQLYLQFVSDKTKNSPGFFIQWTSAATGCGGTLNSPTGTIISPHYPEPYARNAECFWKIGISAGSRIQVVFADLDLEYQSDCLMDYVQFFDGKDTMSKKLGKYCKMNHETPVIQSSSNLMMVKFHSDINYQGRGFNLQYSSICKTNITGYRGVIESPNYPNMAAPNLDCMWEITVAQGNHINITFSQFDIQSGFFGVTQDQLCSGNYLQILYENPETTEEVTFGKYCGLITPDDLTIKSHKAFIKFHTTPTRMPAIFRMEWSHSGCGGLLTRPEDILQTPNYPKVYPVFTTCEWHIQRDFGKSIEITFQEIDMEMNRQCLMDYIKVFNGPDETYPEIATICHSTTSPTVITSTGRDMFVKFVSDVSYNGKGFSATYRTVDTKCGGRMTATSGVFHTPNYPNNYDKNDSCSWLIEVQENHLIDLTFDSVDLLPTAYCNSTFIKVYDGPTQAYPLLARICGKHKPNGTLTSKTNHLFIEMITHSLIATKGFLARYSTACGARITTQGGGVISYAPETLTSTNKTNCTWTIISENPEEHIILTFTKFQNGPCYMPSDALESIAIYDGEDNNSSLIGTYCEKMPTLARSSGSMLHIVVPESYNDQMIFSARYTVVESSCGGEFSAETGVFSTPNYPESYPVDVQCEWTINAGQGNKIQLVFSKFDLVQSDNCNEDYLEIRQLNRSGQLLGTYCGTNKPTNISGLEALWLYFRSEKADVGTAGSTAKGFLSEFSLSTLVELSGTNGKISSPLYPERFMNNNIYKWQITVKSGYHIVIEIEDYQFEMATTYACYGTSITVYDGDESGTTVGEFCGNDPVPIKSTSNVVLIVFSGQAGNRGSTFLLNWKQIRATNDTNLNCSNSRALLIDHSEYILKSNRTLALTKTCDWTFYTKPGRHLNIVFTKIDVNGMYQCRGDSIHVFNGNGYGEGQEVTVMFTKVITVCSSINANKSINTSGDSLQVRYEPSSFWFRYNSFTGFTANITDVCGGSLSQSNGVIQLNGETERRIGKMLECTWTIKVPTGKLIYYEILPNITKNHDCAKNIVVRNGISETSPMEDSKYCESGKVYKANTTSNSANIKFIGDYTDGVFIRFNAISQTECGGKMTLSQMYNSTVINSPSYPNAPPKYSECIWIISVPSGEAVRIDFLERFDVEKSQDCIISGVEIRDGATRKSPIIGVYCDQMPSTQTTLENIVYIRFYTDTEDPGNGFQAKVSIAYCGGTIRGSEGIVTSPGFMHKSSYPKNTICKWEIVAPAGHNMNLTFDVLDMPRTSIANDSVEIVEPDPDVNGTDKSLFQYPPRKPKDVIQSAGNKVFVNFKTGMYSNYNGFKLSFIASTEKCGGELSTSSGTIMSPHYPSPYGIIIRCTWLITVPKGQRIKLEFEDIDFSVEDTANQGIACFSGDSFASNVLFYTGRKSANTKIIRSSDNIMRVYYWSSGPDSHRGFKATYTSDEPSICTGDTSQATGVIRQPNQTTYICQWEIKPPKTKSQTISISVEAKLTTIGTCHSLNSPLFISENLIDHLSNPLAVFCKSTTTPVIVRTLLPKPILFAMVKYKERQVNFTVKYKVNDCGGEIDTASTYIQSPKGVIDCAWKLNGIEGEQHSLKVTTFELEDCDQSYLLVYNGESSRSPRIGQYCGTNIPKTILSQGRYLRIEYHGSDKSSFNITYEKVSKICGGIIHEEHSLIETPGYPNSYENNAECLWELRSTNGYYISLQFPDRFQLEDSDKCTNDYVSVYENERDEEITKKYCGRQTPPGINSTGSQLFVKFKTNDRIGGSGFKATWKWSCGGKFNATSYKQYIESPGYPEMYKSNMRCEYIISAPRKHILIKFEDFDIEKGSTSCIYDKLLVTRPHWHRAKGTPQCGSTLPADLRLYQFANLTFITDKWVNKRGFKLSYEIYSCGENITEPQVIQGSSATSLAIFDNFSPVVSCTWNITAPKGKRINIIFQSVNITYNMHCSTQFVSVTDDTGTLASLCGDLPIDSLPTISSNKQSLLLTFQHFTYFRKLVNFQAMIEFTYGPEVGCGGLINLTYAPAHMLQFKPPGDNYDCIWHIQTGIDYTINIEFEDDANDRRCRELCCVNYEMRDGNRSLSDSIFKNCDVQLTNPIPLSYVTSGPNAWLRIDATNATYSIAKIRIRRELSICGHLNLTPTNDTQYITTPGYPRDYPMNTRCVWRIKTKYMYGIHLKFVEFNMNKDDRNITTCKHLDRLEIVDKNTKAFNINHDVVTNRPQSHFELNRFDPYYDGQHTFCSTADKGYDFVSIVSHIQLTFYSNDKRKSGNGFKIEYKLADCNREYTGLSGFFPRMQTIGNCTATITVPSNYTISLYFGSNANIFHYPCTMKSVEIFDGTTASEPVRRLCGSIARDPVFSTSNVMIIKTINLMRYGTYSSYMTYVASDKGRGCGGDLYMFKGTFSSPLYPKQYTRNTICRWNVKVPMGLKLAISFKWFDIKGACTQTYVKMIQPNTPDASPQIYCSQDTPALFIADSGSVTVEYKSSPENIGTGWWAAFMAVTSDVELDNFAGVNATSILSRRSRFVRI